MCELTDRQLEIVKHLCNGMSLEEISGEMYLSLTTVKNHVAAAKRLTGAKTNVHLASIVIASGKLYWTPTGRSTENAGQAGLPFSAQPAPQISQ